MNSGARIPERNRAALISGSASRRGAFAPPSPSTPPTSPPACTTEPKLTRSVSPRTAFAAGWVLEKLYALLRRRDEPPMTRWVAHVKTAAHWFDISAANNEFGYSPTVLLADGLARLAAWYRAQLG